MTKGDTWNNYIVLKHEHHHLFKDNENKMLVTNAHVYDGNINDNGVIEDNSSNYAEARVLVMLWSLLVITLFMLIMLEITMIILMVLLNNLDIGSFFIHTVRILMILWEGQCI